MEDLKAFNEKKSHAGLANQGGCLQLSFKLMFPFLKWRNKNGIKLLLIHLLILNIVGEIVNCPKFLGRMRQENSLSMSQADK